MRARVLAAAALVAVVSAVTFGALLAGLQAQRDAASRGRSTSDALAAATNLQRLTLDLETGVRGYILTRDEDFLAPYERARRRFAAAGAQLADVEHDPRQAAQVARLRADIYAYAAGYLASVVRLVREGSPAARSAETARRGKVQADRIQAELDGIVGAEQAELDERRANAADLRNRAIRTAIAGLAVLLALVAALAIGAVRAIVVPVGRLQRFARELGAGRFGARLPESGPPETVDLAHAFNATAVELDAAQAELRRLSERHLAELDAVFRAAPLGLAFVGRDLRFLRVNEALAEMDGRPVAEHVGRPVGDLGADVEAALRDVLATGGQVLDRELVRGEQRFLTSGFPVHDEAGDLLAVGVAVTDVTERRRAEAAREQLQTATAALAAAASVEDVARAAVAEAGGALGTASAALFVLERGDEALRLVDGRGPATIRMDAALPVAECLRRRAAVHLHDPAAVAERWPGLEARALAALPLIASGRALGALVLAFPRAMAFDAGERALLDALAAQSAVALARAQLYEREHVVSRTLQASLLPRALPAIPGLDLAARLEAGAPGLDVGGDFYDAFAIADGVWGVAVGDVCGKGVDAAALTALARHTVRAAAMGGAAPSAVLTALNRAVLDDSRPGEFLTAIFARLTAGAGGRFELALACGGHPPPVVLDAALAPRALTCAGTLLGVVGDPEIEDAAVVLEAGDTLLLYTDGLSEAGAPARTLTTPEVAQLLAAVRGETAAQTAEGCLARALAASGGATRDDIAVLVAQVAMGARRRGSTTGRNRARESSTRGQ